MPKGGRKKSGKPRRTRGDDLPTGDDLLDRVAARQRNARTRVDPSYLRLGVLIGLAVTPFALFLALRSTGGGHGSYLAAIVLFPLPMATIGVVGYIGLFALALAFVQFPAYGLILGYAASRGG